MRNSAGKIAGAGLALLALGGGVAWWQGYIVPNRDAHELLAALHDHESAAQLAARSRRTANFSPDDADAGAALLEAIQAGQADVVRLLLQHKANPDARNADPARAAWMAAAPGQAAALNWTALMLAARRGDTALATQLLDAGADIDATDAEGETALMKSLPDRKMTALLLARRANTAMATKQGETALMQAVRADAPDIAGLLLARGADADAKNRAGATALGIAAALGRTGPARVLLAPPDRKAADVNARDARGYTPLMMACAALAALRAPEPGSGPAPASPGNAATADAKGAAEMVQLLLAHGAEVNARDNEGESALYVAAGGEAADLAPLLAAGADVKAITGLGETALHNAARHGRAAVIRLLLQRGADVRARARSPDKAAPGETALGVAALNGHLAAFQTLLAGGAALGQKNESGETVLMLAAQGGNVELVQFILARGAPAGAATTEGRTALFYAALGNRPAVIRLLLQKGLPLNAAATDGKTALMVAAENGSTEAVSTLLESGANTRVTDAAGESALDLARKNQRMEAIALLTPKRLK